MKYALINSVIYTKNEVLRDYAVVIEGGIYSIRYSTK